MKISLFSGVALGAMTATERSKGRYMRGPDDHGTPTPPAAPQSAADKEFAEFEALSPVEVGDPEPKAPKPRPPRAKVESNQPDPAEEKIEVEKDGEEIDGDEGEPGDDEGEPGDDEGEPGDDEATKAKRSESHMKRLKRERFEARQEARDLKTRLAVYEELGIKGPLPKVAAPVNSVPEIGEAPDVTDAEKYPLGHLDDKYVEDKLEWLALRNAAKSAQAVLQRQQENQATQQQQERSAAIMSKVETLATKGSEDFPDFQETVVETGLKGEWDLGETTFNAAHDADHGAQILYDLSRDKKEATRVSKLSDYEQLKWVQAKDAEIALKKKPRTKPAAGEPPANTPRGANSRMVINPATDNLDDFEKAWAADEKSSR